MPEDWREQVAHCNLVGSGRRRTTWSQSTLPLAPSRRRGNRARLRACARTWSRGMARVWGMGRCQGIFSSVNTRRDAGVFLFGVSVSEGDWCGCWRVVLRVPQDGIGRGGAGLPGSGCCGRRRGISCFSWYWIANAVLCGAEFQLAGWVFSPRSLRCGREIGFLEFGGLLLVGGVRSLRFGRDDGAGWVEGLVSGAGGCFVSRPSSASGWHFGVVGVLVVLWGLGG